MWKDQELIDPVVARKLGNIEPAALQEIINICEEALIAISDPVVYLELVNGQASAERVVPWLWDLATGLYFQSIRGPEQPTTTELLEQFSDSPLPTARRDQLAENIDWACILTEDRVAQYVGGIGALRTNPIERRDNYPWYERLLLGYRIRLTTEALRLLQGA
jgi:hypothetical protein